MKYTWQRLLLSISIAILTLDFTAEPAEALGFLLKALSGGKRKHKQQNSDDDAWEQRKGDAVKIGAGSRSGSSGSPKSAKAGGGSWERRLQNAFTPGKPKRPAPKTETKSSGAWTPSSRHSHYTIHESFADYYDRDAGDRDCDWDYMSQRSYRSRGYGSGSAWSRPTDMWIAASGGQAAMAANTIADAPLPGGEFSLAVGGRGSWLGFEGSLSMAGFRLDPVASIATDDIALLTMAGDLRLQARNWPVQPYVYVGLAAHALSDNVMGDQYNGLGLRGGLGLEVRWSHLGLFGQYALTAMELQNDNLDELVAATEAVQVGIKILF